MLLDVRDKAYMLHYICYGSEKYNLCYQEDKSLFPSFKVNHAALSWSENYATPPKTTHQETIEIKDSDTEPDRKLKDRLIDTPLGDKPQKLLEKVDATSSQQPHESTPEAAIPSLPPISKQLQKPSPKAPSATALTATQSRSNTAEAEKVAVNSSQQL